MTSPNQTAIYYLYPALILAPIESPESAQRALIAANG